MKTLKRLIKIQQEKWFLTIFGKVVTKNRAFENNLIILVFFDFGSGSGSPASPLWWRLWSIFGKFPDFMKLNRNVFTIFKNRSCKPVHITKIYEIISFSWENFLTFCESSLHLLELYLDCMLEGWSWAKIKQMF